MRWVLAIALLCIGVLCVLSRPIPAHLVQSEVSSNSVSLVRVRTTVEALSRVPHPIGSSEQHRARELIVGELRRNGVQVSERTGSAAMQMAGTSHAAYVHNLLATVPGRDPAAKSVLLVAHYDTVPNSRGASDDGAAVAALIETARLIAAAPRLQRTVRFLFTDAEERGLLGAQSFVEADPIAREVGLVVNFEARGTSGPLIMYQTSRHSAELVADYGHFVPYPHTNSLITELSRFLPNDSDASVFARAGYPVLALAFVENFEHYHRYSDSAENLDARTLAHCAAQAHAIASHFGDLNHLPRDSGDSVYFDAFSRGVLSYPTWFASALGTLCLLGWLALAAREVKARRCTVRGIRRGAKFQLLVIGLGLVIPVMLHLLRSLMIDELDLVRNSATYGLTDVLVLTALNLFFHARATRRGAKRELILGSLSISVVLGVTLGWLVPQASAPWQWVSTCALIVWWLEPRIAKPHHTLRLIAQHLPLAVVVLLLVPVVHTAIASAGPALMAIPLLLTASVMELVFATLLTKEARLIPSAAAMSIAGFALMCVIALVPCSKHSRAATASLVYGYDNDTNTAVYASQQTQDNAFTRQWVPRTAEQKPLTAFTPALALWRQTPAPIYPQPMPEITVNELAPNGNRRQIDVHVSSSPEFTCIVLWQTEGDPLQVLSVNGQPLVQFVRFSAQVDALGLQLLSGIREREVWKFEYCGLRETPLVLRVAVPRGPSIRVRAVTVVPELPKLMTLTRAARPPELIPGMQSDVTLLGQALKL